MSSKRTTKPSSQEQEAEKKQKLDDGRGVSVNESRSSSLLEQELERALHSNDSENTRVLYLAREVAKIPNVPPKLTMRLLKFCVEAGSEDIVRQFLNNPTIDLKSPEGGELLWAAVDEAQVEIAAMLVRSGADLSVRQGNHSFLHGVLNNYQIKDQAKEELIRLMIDYGADVNACDSNGYSVLHEALHDHCSSELVEVLLQRGANVTINEEMTLDDLYRASCYKPELLPKLIEHQVPDEQTRNNRGFLAIEHLLTKDKTDAKMNDTLKLIKQILDLGVPVNNAGPIPERRRQGRPCPLLSTALILKKKDAVKLLIEYGADPHQPDDLGQTPLYQATAFAGYTHACRWLIERGADIHTPNDDKYGCYPIHGAYQHQSVKNLHLLLSLGADINVTDKRGLTPFQCCGDIIDFKDYHGLCIKHFALIIAKGGEVSDDIAFAKKYVWGSQHFEKCEQQLQQMKKEYICDKISYFSLLSKNMFYMLWLMKKSEFVRNFKKSEQKRTTLFPQYTWMLLHSFEIAEIRYNMLRRQEKLIKKASRNMFPDHIVESIALYSCLDKLERCSHDYYMNFHANLKKTKADKEKIL